MKTRYLSIAIFIVLICAFDASLNAQNITISGLVKDSSDAQPLPFVNIVAGESLKGCITDIDGRFSLEIDPSIKYLRLSYVGYKPDTFYLTSGKSNYTIDLVKNSIQLHEVVILPGINPAHRIIQNAIDHRLLNDPYSNESFSYSSYSKFFVTAEVDSLYLIPDENLDSNALTLKRFFESHYLFLMESVTKRIYMAPTLSNERVLASRVSGFTDPFFTLLMTQIQSFAFYNDLISISDKNYVNPISRGSTSKYFFLLEDTIYEGQDSIFVISYKPRRGSNFDALKGLLYIHTANWAIQSVIAEPAQEDDGVSIRIRQNYVRIGDKWFPSQLHTEFFFSALKVGEYPLYGRGETRIIDPQINLPLKRSDFPDAAVTIEPDAAEKDPLFWANYRPENLSPRDTATYSFIDSISKAENMNRLLDISMALVNGYIPVKFLNIDIGRIYNYNDFEGSRLGLGLATNYRLSKRFSIGGYYAYGFKDKQHKFGGNVDYLITPGKNAAVKIGWLQDVSEIGEVKFADARYNPLNPDNYRDFMLSRLNYIERAFISYHFRPARYTTLYAGLEHTEEISTGDYIFGQELNSGFSGTGSFIFTEALLGLRYAYGEKLISSTNYMINMGGFSPFPIINIQIQRGFKSLLNGSFDYTLIHFKYKQSLKTKYFGTSSLMIQAGIADRSLPLALLFNAPSSYRNFTIDAPWSFQCMRMDEFFSDRYLYLFFRHNFGKLLLRAKWFQPSFAILTSVAFGSLSSLNNHRGVDFKTLDKGYYESGLQVNNILNLGFYSLGIGVMYRYGAYSFDEWKRNVSWRLTLGFPI